MRAAVLVLALFAAASRALIIHNVLSSASTNVCSLPYPSTTETLTDYGFLTLGSGCRGTKTTSTNPSDKPTRTLLAQFSLQPPVPVGVFVNYFTLELNFACTGGSGANSAKCSLPGGNEMQLHKVAPVYRFDDGTAIGGMYASNGDYVIDLDKVLSGDTLTEYVDSAKGFWKNNLDFPSSYVGDSSRFGIELSLIERGSGPVQAELRDVRLTVSWSANFDMVHSRPDTLEIGKTKSFFLYLAANTAEPKYAAGCDAMNLGSTVDVTFLRGSASGDAQMELGSPRSILKNEWTEGLIADLKLNATDFAALPRESQVCQIEVPLSSITLENGETYAVQLSVPQTEANRGDDTPRTSNVPAVSVCAEHGECNGHGTCNSVASTCDCESGYAAPDCATVDCAARANCNSAGKCVGPNQCMCDDPADKTSDCNGAINLPSTTNGNGNSNSNGNGNGGGSPGATNSPDNGSPGTTDANGNSVGGGGGSPPGNNVSGEPPTASDDQLPIIIGAAAGGVCLICVLVLAVVMMRRRKSSGGADGGGDTAMSDGSPTTMTQGHYQSASELNDPYATSGLASSSQTIATPKPPAGSTNSGVTYGALPDNNTLRGGDTGSVQYTSFGDAEQQEAAVIYDAGL